MPLPRHGIWASVIGNKIYIPGGGTTPALINPTNTNQIFTVSATAVAAARATVADFNNDGHPDYVLRNAATRQTAIWYLNNNVLSVARSVQGITAGWGLEGVADFNGDIHPDYALV